MAAPKIVVPDHGEIWCRQESRRHVETIDISCIAQFITHQEISPKNASYTLNKYIVMRTSGITAIPPLNCTCQVFGCDFLFFDTVFVTHQ